MSVEVAHQWGVECPVGEGFDFSPYLVDGQQGVASMGGQSKGPVARKTIGAPILLRTFYKSSEATTQKKI